MRGPPPRDAHADRRDLVVADPDAALPLGARGGDAVLGARADQHFLEIRHVLAHVAIPFPEVEDRIAGELAAAVIGDVAAALRGEEADALCGERVGRGEQVRRVAAAAEGDERRMFAAEKLVVDLLALAPLDELLLELQRFFVSDEMKSVELTTPHVSPQRDSSRPYAFAPRPGRRSPKGG